MVDHDSNGLGKTKRGKGMTDKEKTGIEAEPAVNEDKINERRRALIHAGWSVPIVTTVSGLSSNAAFAQSPHADGHGDAPPHADAPHNDAPHTDVPHNDIHGDAPGRAHGDTHDDVTVLHIDIPHGDIGIGFGTPHVDTAFAHGDSHNDVPAIP